MGNGLSDAHGMNKSRNEQKSSTLWLFEWLTDNTQRSRCPTWVATRVGPSVWSENCTLMSAQLFRMLLCSFCFIFLLAVLRSFCFLSFLGKSQDILKRAACEICHRHFVTWQRPDYLVFYLFNLGVCFCSPYKDVIYKCLNKLEKTKIRKHKPI